MHVISFASSRASPPAARRLTSLMRALCVAGLHVMAFGNGATPATSTQPPLRIVRASPANVVVLKWMIKASHDACRAEKGLPPSAPPMPSEQRLASFKVMEEEELFDGRAWAEFSVSRTIAADARNACRLTVFSERHATVEHDCKVQIIGGTELLADMVRVPAEPLERPTLTEDDLTQDVCELPTGVPVSVAGLPTDRDQQVACVWNARIIARDLQAARLGPATPQADEVDMCVYAKRPSYHYASHDRPVVVRTKAPPPTDDTAEAALRSLRALRLVEFSDGTPIPASRFTRAAVQNFVNLPTTEPLGDQ